MCVFYLNDIFKVSYQTSHCYMKPLLCQGSVIHVRCMPCKICDTLKFVILTRLQMDAYLGTKMYAFSVKCHIFRDVWRITVLWTPTNEPNCNFLAELSLINGWIWLWNKFSGTVNYPQYNVRGIFQNKKNTFRFSSFDIIPLFLKGNLYEFW
jgi:hypothetical protein